MLWWLVLLGCGGGDVATSAGSPRDASPAAVEVGAAEQGADAPADEGDAGDDAGDALRDGPNLALVQAHCTVCHGAALLRGQHLSRDRWDALITWMQQEQGLWKLPDDVRGQILDYLVATQGPGDAEGVADLPWATGRYSANPL